MRDLPTETVKRLIECNIKIAVVGELHRRLFDFQAHYGRGRSFRHIRHRPMYLCQQRKGKILGVKKETLRQFERYRLRRRRKWRRVCALSRTRISACRRRNRRTDGGTSEKPVGLVYIRYCDETRHEVIKHNAGDTRGWDHARGSVFLKLLVKPIERLL